MAGHSKWANIKHRKAREDAKRGKTFTKLIREIMVTARDGGGDPSGNAHLKNLLDKAKSVNMPQENITRAIKKATGGLEGVNYESVTYEGYGPAGVALIVEGLTDNKKRTVADIRHAFSKSGGSLGEGGSVAWMFSQKGIVRGASQKTEDELLDALIDSDIDNLSVADGLVTLSCDKGSLDLVKQASIAAGVSVEDFGIEWIANDPVHADEEKQEQVFKFLEKLEELDDVQNVFTNLA